jgi:ketosteroid isomerase-like protein
MKKNNKLTLTLLALVALSMQSCKTVNIKNEETQIREFWTKTCDYLCRGDWENYSESWDHSSKIQVIHPEQNEWLTGWEKIRIKYEAMLKSGMSCSLPKNELTLNISEDGKMAWGTVDVIIQFNDSTKTQVHAWETVVFEKNKEEQWKMVLGMASIPSNKNEN